jgi:uncharacterized RDD family membrane protein YckC
MSTNRLAVALACASLVALAAAPPAAASQEPRSPGASATAGRSPAAPASAAAGAASEPEPLQAERARHIFQVRPVVRIGQDYTLPAGEVAWELRSALGDVVIGGRVERDAVAILGDVRLASTAVVERSLLVWGGNVTIEPGAVVSRDLVVVGGALTAPADFAPGGGFVAVGSPVLVEIVRAILPWLTRGLLWGRLVVPDLGWVWLAASVIFLVFLAINTIFGGPVGQAANAVQERPLSTLLLGLLVLVLTVPAVVILAATVVGIVILPFVLGALLAAGLVGKAGVARAIGRSLTGRGAPESRLHSLVAFLVGSCVLLVAYMVPILGLVTWSLTTVLAVGASAVMLRGALRSERPKVEASASEPPAPPRSAAFDYREPPSPPVEAEPVPASGADAGLSVGPPAPRAAFLDRTAAFALDCMLVGVAVLVFDFSDHDGAFPLLLFAYHVAYWAWKGTTIGGIVVGVRIVRHDGSDLRFQDALVRGACGLLSLAALGLGCFWMLQDPERQMWHDKIARTVVLKLPRALVLQ